MSYQPIYSSSWMPPPSRDSGRPSASQSNVEPDRRWTGSRVTFEEEDDLVFRGRAQSFSNQDVWRPQRHERNREVVRLRENDRVREDPAFYNPFNSSRPQQSDHPARKYVPASSSPSMAPFLSPNDRQRSPLEDAGSAPRRAKKSPGTSSGKKDTNKLNGPAQGIGSVHRMSLRSRQSNTTHQTLPINQQTPWGPRGMSSFGQPPPKPKKVQFQLAVAPPAPTATDLYLAQARLPLVRSATPKKLLVVLDLNGTLLVRPDRKDSRNLLIRPGVPELLDYLFDNHVVMVYSSARPENVQAMVSIVFRQEHTRNLKAMWGRDKLELTPAQYNDKVQVYKKLEKVWADEQIQASCVGGQRWSQANTILVDDNHLKASSQPHNLIQVAEFTKLGTLTKAQRRKERGIVASIQAKLEELKWSHDVSRHILRWQTGALEPPHSGQSSPLPTGADGPPGAQAWSNVDGTTEHDATQAALENDMEHLNTNSDPVSEDENADLSQPAVSAAEWREFLK